MRTVLASCSALVILAGCASIQPTAHEHAAHHAGPPSATAQADHQMKMMQEMHQKMMAAKTPQERQALMAEHMKAMQGGLSMMCEMGQQMDRPMGTPGAQPDRPMAPPGAAASAPGQSGMSMGSGQQGMMHRCMAMRDMTMRMMMERENAPK